MKSKGDASVKEEIAENVKTEKSGLDDKKALKSDYISTDKTYIAEVSNKADILTRDNEQLRALMEQQKESLMLKPGMHVIILCCIKCLVES